MIIIRLIINMYVANMGSVRIGGIHLQTSRGRKWIRVKYVWGLISIVLVGLYQLVPSGSVVPKPKPELAQYDFSTMWLPLRLQGSSGRTFSMEATEDIQHTSADIAEQKIGTLLDNTGLRVLGGVPHYIGDVKDENGRAMIRHVAVEGAPHYPSAYCAELAWEFLHSFSRDLRTGELKFD